MFYFQKMQFILKLPHCTQIEPADTKFIFHLYRFLRIYLHLWKITFFKDLVYETFYQAISSISSFVIFYSVSYKITFSTSKLKKNMKLLEYIGHMADVCNIEYFFLTQIYFKK